MQHLTPTIAPVLDELGERLAAPAEWTPAALEAIVRDVAARHGLKLGKLAQPTRVALTGGTASPGLFEVMVILGRDKTLARLAAAREYILHMPSRS